MSYYLLNSYCSPKPYTVVESVKPIEAGINIVQTQNSKPVTTQSPEIFGPAFWFSLHTGAAYLPEVLSPISANRIRGFINGIPEMVPCIECSEHSRAYIEANKIKIDTLKRGDDVFRFYVDFHNYVNLKLGKPVFSYEKAFEMYRGGVHVRTMKY